MSEDVVQRRSWFARPKKSTRTSRLPSFISYFSRRNSNNGSELISTPSNFERREYSVENFENQIQECPFDVTGYGHLILKDKFKLLHTKTKLLVFMFENIIVFTELDSEQDAYYYKGSIKMTDLAIPPLIKKRILLLNDFVKSKATKTNHEYKLEAQTDEKANEWRNAIQKCLWKELLHAREMHKLRT